MRPSNRLRNLKLLAVAAGIAAIGAVYATSSVFASHSFEAGVKGDSLPDNTHIRLDGLALPPGGVLPLYDASPNFVAGHFLLRGPCYENHVPLVTVIAGHIDESMHGTYVDKVPLYYIDHASTAGSCVWHAHIPDPLNGGAPRVTDIDLINLSGEDVTFNPGDAVDINVQRVLGSIGDAPYDEMQLPGELTHGNPVFDLNDENMDNDGLGFLHEEGGE
ncbi:MAG: hypothetical protein MN733_19490 [Nitrososphaera sp.]|nr:hypothetical protein [Nitrososphaera sp.]